MDLQQHYLDASGKNSLNPPDRPVQIKSKIICTIGPKTQSSSSLLSLIKAGMGVARMNFSHGSHEYHQKTINNLKECLEGMKGRSVAVLLDTKGPEIRYAKLYPMYQIPKVFGINSVLLDPY
jgi:pyruvate kinase